MIKQTQVYQSIRQEILNGIWKPGDKLPTELEYVRKLGISRNTLRGGMKKLEEEDLIERIKSKGTFVKFPKAEPEDKNISLLVPCCEYLQCCGIHFIKLMFELIAEAAAVGWRITPVIFSRTNDPKDVWLENLSHIRQNSRIVIYHDWYASYFKTLRAIGARVAYVDNEWDLSGKREPFNSWMKFIEQDRLAARKCFAFLRDSGCRKIALAMRDLNFPSNTLADEYSLLCREYGSPRMAIPTTDGTEGIAMQYRRDRFDGILLHCNEQALPRKPLREALGLPPDMPLAVIPQKLEGFFAKNEGNTAVIEYPLTSLARDIVRKLVGGTYTPQKSFYAPSLRKDGKELFADMEMNRGER